MSDGWLTRGGDDLLDLGGASPIAAASQVGTVSAAVSAALAPSPLADVTERRANLRVAGEALH